MIIYPRATEFSDWVNKPKPVAPDDIRHATIASQHMPERRNVYTALSDAAVSELGLPAGRYSVCNSAEKRGYVFDYAGGHIGSKPVLVIANWEDK